MSGRRSWYDAALIDIDYCTARLDCKELDRLRVTKTRFCRSFGG